MTLVVRLKDVARVELGGESSNVYRWCSTENRRRASGISWQPARMLSIPRKPLRQNWRNYRTILPAEMKSTLLTAQRSSFLYREVDDLSKPCWCSW
ncbi:hypothetical protein ACNKHL_19905 [Shigella flexneri]